MEIASEYFFVSDLHGDISRYKKLFQIIEEDMPAAVFLGGDLLPSGLFAISSNSHIQKDFIVNMLIDGFSKLKSKLKNKYPAVFIILGNDDSKSDEPEILKGEELGYWKYIHNNKAKFQEYIIYGYSYIPPSPFLLKDFEKYDVSRFVDPGCVPPEEGVHTVPINKELLKISTIKKDLDNLIQNEDLSKTIILFHCPPYQSNLDRANLDNQFYNHVPLDVHIGSIAIQRFINKKQPKITLHGHVHESAGITGSWKDTLGKTKAFSAAHDGKELALVRFDPSVPEKASRELI